MNILGASLGLAITATGTFLPWARIGGRNRSGFSTADTFISLADRALPSEIAWVGRWWYLPTVLAVAAWASTFVNGTPPIRLCAGAMIGCCLAMWWLFCWAGSHYNLLDMNLVGPLVATVGLSIIAASSMRSHGSLLRPRS